MHIFIYHLVLYCGCETPIIFLKCLCIFIIQIMFKVQCVLLTVMLMIVDDWLTVHRSITLVNFQLDAQNSYLFI